jgi:hypothetical protein
MEQAAVREGSLRGTVYDGRGLRVMLCYSLEDGKLGERGRHMEEGQLLTEKQGASNSTLRSN